MQKNQNSKKIKIGVRKTQKQKIIEIENKSDLNLKKKNQN